MRLVSAKPREMDAIVIEDLSRLSRAVADRVHGAARVRMSRNPAHRNRGWDRHFREALALTFGRKSVISTIYLDDLHDKTLRGLEGRALAGDATGGVCFGYSLRKEMGSPRQADRDQDRDQPGPSESGAADLPPLSRRAVFRRDRERVEWRQLHAAA